MRPAGTALAIAALVALATGPAAAQELEPRAYSPNPVGANFVAAVYGYQEGDLLFDPTVPITDAEAFVNSAIFGYVRTFGLFGRTASAGVVVPYVWASMNGNVYEDRRDITRSGLADSRWRLSVNLLGGPAMTPGEFAKRRPGPTLGASLTVNAPTGQYDGAKLANLGTNRWAFKPEVGFSYPVGPWAFELYTGVWLFTRNSDFFGGKVFEQDPLLSLQAHVAYTIKPRMWVAFNTTYYAGGLTHTDGVAATERQNNSRVGLTFALPIGKRHSLKLAWARGVTTRVGDKVDMYQIAYQFFWLDRK